VQARRKTSRMPCKFTLISENKKNEKRKRRWGYWRRWYLKCRVLGAGSLIWGLDKVRFDVLQFRWIGFFFLLSSSIGEWVNYFTLLYETGTKNQAKYTKKLNNFNLLIWSQNGPSLGANFLCPYMLPKFLHIHLKRSPQ